MSSDPHSTSKASKSKGLRGLAQRLLGPARYKATRSVLQLASKDEAGKELPLSVKMRAWQHGFFGESAVLYGFDNLASGNYLTDYERLVRTGFINSIPALFNHKLLLRQVLQGAGIAQPETIAYQSTHGFLLDPLGSARHCTADELTDIVLRQGGQYILKPEAGARGGGISLLEVENGALVQRRGTTRNPFRFAQLKPAGRLLERRIEQHAFWQALSPHSVNTMRVLTMWIPGEAAPFIARAAQRMGTQATLPTDNWSGGGIVAGVDHERGTLMAGRINPSRNDREDRLHARHPETGAQLEGAVIPSWDRIVETTLAAARRVPYAPYVGWDVAVDVTGTPVIIEGNRNSGVNTLQAHRGLLVDPRVRRFYEAYGIG